MTRLTGLIKPQKGRANQCPDCKRYFTNVRIHKYTGTACKELRGAN